MCLSAAWLLPGCVHPLNPETKRSDLVICLSSALDAAIETKAVEEGDTFNEVLVLVTRDGAVLHRQVVSLQSEVSYTEVHFRNVEIGSYDVYAYANYTSTAWQESNNTVSDNELVENMPFSTQRTLKALTGRDVPAAPASQEHMLLTGFSVIPVGVANNIGSIKLYRPVIRLNVWLNNHTPKSIRVDDIGFNYFNASNTFLLGRTDDEGRPVMPSGVLLRPLPLFSFTESIPKDGRVKVYSTLLYEMQLPENEVCRIYTKLTMLTDDTPYPVVELGSRSRPDDQSDWVYSGEVLKLVDNQTSQVSLLRSFPRNRVLNVELNAYYEKVAGDISFRVDNDTWLEDPTRTSSHIYK